MFHAEHIGMNVTNVNAQHVVYKCHYYYDNDEDRKKLTLVVLFNDVGIGFPLVWQILMFINSLSNWDVFLCQI